MFFRSNFGALELQIVQYIYNALFFWGGVQKGAVCLYLYRFTRSSLITPLQFRPNAKS